MKKLLFCLLFVPTICLAANDDISDRPELGTAVNTDSILAVNAGNTAGDRLARILFQGTNGYVLTGNGTWFDLTSALASKQDTLTNPLTQSDIDDTPSDGNTTQPASSNSVFDGLAGKEPTQTAASQAEAEAGTEAAIRSFSPLRISQGIAAYFLSNGVGIEVDSTLSTSGTDPVTIGLSTASKTKEVCWLIKNATIDTAIADGLEAFVVPVSLNGMNLVDLTCAVADLNSAASGATTVVLRRVRGATAVDMTSTGVTINYDEYSASDETVDTANDDLATGDKIYVDVNAVTTAVQKGLSCTASFRLP